MYFLYQALLTEDVENRLENLAPPVAAPPAYLKIILSSDNHQAPWKYEELPNLIQKSQGEGGAAVPENLSLPAGFTYLGQFIAHDISSGRLTDANGTPTLDLKSLYGGGPDMMHFLYIHYPREAQKLMGMPEPQTGKEADEGYLYRGVKFRLRSQTKNGYPQFDVERTVQRIALMADCRNDQHFILSQLHVAFLRFHNAVVDFIAHTAPPMSRGELFRASREMTIHHYQWMIVHFYLKALVKDPGLIDDLLADNRNFKFFDPSIPVLLTPEFSDAVFRMGHSQIAEAYHFPDNEERFVFREGKEADLRGFIDRMDDEEDKLRMDWRFFFDLGDPDENPQFSSGIDHFFVDPLARVPFFPSGERNLVKKDIMKRSIAPGHLYALGLQGSDPSYQPLTIEELQKLPGWPDIIWTEENILKIPLSLYVLLEAKIRCKGRKLGTLGSRIIAEQLVWAIKSHSKSFHKKPGGFQPEAAFMAWRKFVPNYALTLPQLPNSAEFGIQDILQFPDFVAQTVADIHQQERGEAQRTPNINFNESIMNNLLPTANQSVSNIIYLGSKAAFNDAGMRTQSFNDPKYSKPLADYVSSSFSAYSISTMIGLQGSFNNLVIKDEGVGLTFFFGWEANNLVLMSRLTNSTNIYLAGTGYLVSTGNTASLRNNDADFLTARDAVIQTGIQNVSVENHPKFSFAAQDLYDLIFEPGHNVAGTVDFELVLGPCATGNNPPPGNWLNLMTVINDTSYLLGEGCPDKCYYRKVSSTPQPNGA